MDRKRENAKYVLFWIKSNRGTDEKAIFEIPKYWNKEDIRSALEKWCSGFGAWTHGDNAMNYGWKSMSRIPDKKELKRRYNLVCKSKAKITEKWKFLAAMFNIKTLA